MSPENAGSDTILDFADQDLSIATLLQSYRCGRFTPQHLIRQLHQSIATQIQGQTDPVWIYLLSGNEIEPYLQRLATMADDLPLYGIPFAIKDNIDLAGVPTTAACAEFTYIPEVSSTVVQRLIDAGAIPLGKTNLDQFATGLVGVRSPYGICQNALNSEYISGGSSSGSAIALAKNWVSFSLGTDTAGSGRVPAALNGLVGLKPTRGLFSNHGLVPACRSLDCISVFSRSVEDANIVFDVACAYDRADPYSRKNSYANGPRFGGLISPPWTLGVPKEHQLNFFDDRETKDLFYRALEQFEASGVTLQEVDFQPFLNAAKLLYEGPWVAERYLATQALLQTNPQAMLPVTREIIAAGEHLTATSAFSAQYQLQTCAQQAAEILAQVDCMITPTIGTDYKIAEVLADPIRLNSNLGYYTNFMNLLDCAALALPAGFKSTGVGFGVTLFQGAFSDKTLVGIGRFAESVFGAVRDNSTLTAAQTHVDLVVCGAHLQGLPLNWQLLERGAKMIQTTRTSAHYQLFALPGGPPERPGLIRVDSGGAAIAVEIWRLPVGELGSFVAGVPAPLAIGKVEMTDGRWLTGFVCEAIGLNRATNITACGGWHQYLLSKSLSV